MTSETHPTAVALARVLLVVIGILAFALGGGLYFSGMDLPMWQWLLILGVGTLSLLSALFESASGVVATAITFLYPLS